MRLFQYFEIIFCLTFFNQIPIRPFGNYEDISIRIVIEILLLWKLKYDWKNYYDKWKILSKMFFFSMKNQICILDLYFTNLCFICKKKWNLLDKPYICGILNIRICECKCLATLIYNFNIDVLIYIIFLCFVALIL